MSYYPSDVPPLPGEKLHRVKTVARRAKCTPDALYDAIRNRRLGAVTVDGVLHITESEAERFIREWPSKNRGVSARWAEYRVWKASHGAAIAPGAA
jgi:hypothetical protein